MFKKIASNAISQILSKLITAVISIFLIGILTNYFSTSLYGEYNKLYNYLSIFAFMADLGLYTITIREISKNKENAEYIIGNSISLRLILGTFIIFLALIISIFLPGYNNEMTFYGVLIVSFFTLFSLLNSSVMSLMQAYMKIEFSLISSVFGKIINFIFIILIALVFYKKGDITDFEIPFFLILGTGVLGILVNFLMNFYYANKIVKIRFLFDFVYMKKIFMTSLPYGVALFLSVVYMKVDIILLSLLEPRNISNTSIALYSLPMKIVEVLMVLGTFYLNSILPILSEFFKENNIEGIKKILTNSFRFLFSFGVFIVVIGMLFRDYLIKIIATPDYLSHEIHKYTSSDVFSVVLLILLFYFISAIFNYIFISSKNEKKVLYINIFITIFNIVGNIIFIPIYSFMGAGFVTLVSQILLFLMLFYFSRNIVVFKFNFPYILKVLTFSFVFYFVGKYLLTLFSFGVFVDFFLFGTLYGIIFLLFLLFLNREMLVKYKK